MTAAVAVFVELPPDVAYYLAWSRSPQLAYLDHPGAVAWVFVLVPDEGLRVAGVLVPLVVALGHGVLLALLFHALGGGKAAAIALFASPLWLAAGLLWTPDAPLLLAWHAGLLILVTGRGRAWHVVQKKRNRVSARTSATGNL